MKRTKKQIKAIEKFLANRYTKWPVLQSPLVSTINGKEIVSFLDGFRMFITTDLSITDIKTQAPSDLNLEKIWNDHSEVKTSYELHKPSIEELKEIINKWKEDKKTENTKDKVPTYKFMDNGTISMPLVNAKYLLNALEALPKAKLYACNWKIGVVPYEESVKNFHNLYLEYEEDKILLLGFYNNN